MTAIQRVIEKLPSFGQPAAKSLAAFGAVAVWLAFGPIDIYSHIGSLDPWFYTGYFTNFSYLLLHRGFTYYVSRLPWIIPGRIAFSVASPEFASWLLSAAMATGSGLCLYWVVRWYYGHAPAVLAALALITNGYFLGAVCWHYPDGAAIAYAMAGMAFYLRPQGNPLLNGGLAAAALTLSGFTQMAAAPVILGLLAIPLLRWRHSRKELLRQCIGGLAGFGLTTLLLVAASKSMLGDARVYKPQLDMWINIVQHPNYLPDMWGTGPGFLLKAVRLFTPAFLLVFVPVLLMVIRKPAPIAWPCYFAFLICCLLLAYQEFAAHRVSLRVPFVGSYMLVPIFCVVGVALGELWNTKPANPTLRNAARNVAVTALAILTVALPFIYGMWRPYGWPTVTGRPIWIMLAGIGAVTCVVAILERWPGLPLQHWTSALVLIAISAGPGLDPGINAGFGRQKIVHGSNLSNGPNADAFRCLMKFEDYVKSQVDDPRWDLIFWWDEDEPLAELFKSAESLYVIGHANFTKEFSSGSGRLYLPNTMLVHLTSRPERIAERTKLAASRGIGVAYERQTELTFGDARFTVAVQDLKILPALQ